MKRSLCLFLDANIYIAALASPTGPSGRLFELAKSGKFKVVTAKFLLLEVERNLQEKLPETLIYFYQDITQLNFDLVKNIDQALVAHYEQVIDYQPDSLVLAAADQGKADYLITLDKKHLLQENVKKSVRFPIIRPEELLKYFEI